MAVAGCIGPQSPETAAGPGIRIRNTTDATRQVTVRVFVAEKEGPILDRTLTVPVREMRGFFYLDQYSQYQVYVELGSSHAESLLWTTEACPTEMLHVQLMGPAEIEFEQTGC